MLNDLITNNRRELIARTRAKALGRSQAGSADPGLDEGIPLFLDQLSEILCASSSRNGSMDANASARGGELLRKGFSVSQVVHGYGDVCQAVTELAIESNTPIAADDFRVFNRCLDKAIASAVTEYERQREEAISRQGTERLGKLAHELRNSLSTALLAFATLKNGVVGPSSTTGALLNRSLLRLRDLIDRSLAEVRLEAGLLQMQQLSAAEVVQEVAIGAALDAHNRGVVFGLASIDARLEFRADRHLLVGAIENIVQNALKFTPRHGHVLLAAREVSGEVLIEVSDECGGLAPDELPKLFRAFEQQHADERTGLGLGLYISHASVTTMGGRLYAQNVPGKGCVFTIALPIVAREGTQENGRGEDPAEPLEVS